MQTVRQRRVRLGQAGKNEMRSQFAALCYRLRNDKPQILLIASRDSGRWIVPKGWPIDRKTPAQAATREAWEEAGVRGRGIDRCLGIYTTEKAIGPLQSVPCVVAVFPVRVGSLEDDFPEAGQRRRKWFSRKKAARKVTDPELAQIIRHFDPSQWS